MSETEKLLDEARQSLSRVQEFKADSLVQKSRLGESSFDEAAEPAQRVITLFRQLPLSTLEYFSQTELDTVKTQANNIYQIFQQVLSFDVNEGDVRNRQQQQIDNLKKSYQRVFTNLHPLISYSIARTADFAQLSEQGRAAVQEIRDQTERLMSEIEEQNSEAIRILDRVRKTAAERGVSQEAWHFKDEADRHGEEAGRWRTWTIRMAAAVGVYGILTLFFHKIPWLSPQNNYELIQFTIGKVLVFFVLAYMLALCAKNFLSNRHNEIVNRHRQNSLMTYKSLVDAGGTPEARDIILNHAASSVYRMHDTGYTKSGDSSGSSSSSIVEMLPRTSMPINTGGG